MKSKKSQKRWMKKVFLNFIDNIGLFICIKKPDFHYVPKLYGFTANKHIDIRKLYPFSRLSTEAISSGRTGHYYDRLYTVYQLVLNSSRNFSDASLNFAEVGVYKGGTSHFIASILRDLGIKNYSLFCFDTFEGHSPKDIQANIDNSDVHTPYLFNDASLEAVKEYLSDFTNVHIYKGRIQDTAFHIQSQKFHFVHIDTDLYEPIVFALNFFDERLTIKGIIAVDDYGFTTCPGAKRAVDEFVAAHSNYFGFHLLDGKYILVKLEEGGGK